MTLQYLAPGAYQASRARENERELTAAKAQEKKERRKAADARWRERYVALYYIFLLRSSNLKPAKGTKSVEG